MTITKFNELLKFLIYMKFGDMRSFCRYADINYEALTQFLNDARPCYAKMRKAICDHLSLDKMEFDSKQVVFVDGSSFTGYVHDFSPVFNQALKVMIRNKFKSIKNFADKVKINYSQLSAIINGHAYWHPKYMPMVCKQLELNINHFVQGRLVALNGKEKSRAAKVQGTYIGKV